VGTQTYERTQYAMTCTDALDNSYCPLKASISENLTDDYDSNKLVCIVNIRTTNLMSRRSEHRTPPLIMDFSENIYLDHVTELKFLLYRLAKTFFFNNV
jgi:hypothetical protein